MFKYLTIAALLAATPAAAQYYDLDENGFIADVQAVLQKSCTRADGVVVEEWVATTDGRFSDVTYERLIINDEIVAEESEWSGGHRIDLGHARVELISEKADSSFSAKGIRNVLLQEQGLEPWTGCE